MNVIELSLFASQMAAICDEMGAVLRHAAFSLNIRDRLDYSCAVFDADGELCAQAAHIPVHLGSMAFAMRDVVTRFEWNDGDVVIFNDPFLGGTHLPDVTLLSPLVLDGNLTGFVANRAHHADIGAESPGSMPLSRSLYEEGIVITPQLWVHGGKMVDEVMHQLLQKIRNPVESRGDFAAQLSSVRTGVKQLARLVQKISRDNYLSALKQLNDYAEIMARKALENIPDGRYQFNDVMDDDGLGHCDIPIRVTLDVNNEKIRINFAGTAKQVEGNINCPLSVTAAGVFYVFRCLMPENTPVCAGSFRPIELYAPEGCLLNAMHPAAVAAGNVETSTRVVDVLLGALAQVIAERIPAASHGSMNNVAMGSDDPVYPWDYYETIGGGMGASANANGQSGVQTHMTNTLNTPVEALEMHYPLRIRQYAIRRKSGGAGRYRGGDGLIREFEFLRPARATLLTERRRHRPWGLADGQPAKRGINALNRKLLSAKQEVVLSAGDRLMIATPGGGGYAR